MRLTLHCKVPKKYTTNILSIRQVFCMQKYFQLRS